MISKYVNFSGLKSNFLACFAQNIQCICTCYIKLLFNRLIQNMLSVPEVDNSCKIFVQTLVKRDLFQASPATHYCQQYSVHGKYQP